MMTRDEFMEYFMGGVYAVGCFTKEDHDAFIYDVCQGAGFERGQIKHRAGFSTKYPYLFWRENRVFGATVTYSSSDAVRITYEEYLDMVAPLDGSLVNLEEVL